MSRPKTKTAKGKRLVQTILSTADYRTLKKEADDEGRSVADLIRRKLTARPSLVDRIEKLETEIRVLQQQLEARPELG
jgi:hypothetical protein